MDSIMKSVVILDLKLKLPKAYQSQVIDLSFFDFVPETSNLALNSTINEKIRRFNNSTIALMDNFQNIEKFIKTCNNKAENIFDNLCRRYFRNAYLELYIYQEKIINLICNLFFIENQKNRENNFEKIKQRKKYFPLLNDFYLSCKNTKNDPIFKIVNEIRDD